MKKVIISALAITSLVASEKEHYFLNITSEAKSYIFLIHIPQPKLPFQIGLINPQKICEQSCYLYGPTPSLVAPIIKTFFGASLRGDFKLGADKITYELMHIYKEPFTEPFEINIQVYDTKKVKKGDILYLPVAQYPFEGPHLSTKGDEPEAISEGDIPNKLLKEYTLEIKPQGNTNIDLVFNYNKITGLSYNKPAKVAITKKERKR